MLNIGTTTTNCTRITFNKDILLCQLEGSIISTYPGETLRDKPTGSLAFKNTVTCVKRMHAQHTRGHPQSPTFAVVTG